MTRAAAWRLGCDRPRHRWPSVCIGDLLLRVLTIPTTLTTLTILTILITVAILTTLATLATHAILTTLAIQTTLAVLTTLAILATGVRGHGGNFSFLTPSAHTPQHRWQCSAHLTALHSVAAVTLANTLMSCPGYAQPTILTTLGRLARVAHVVCPAHLAQAHLAHAAHFYTLPCTTSCC